MSGSVAALRADVDTLAMALRAEMAALGEALRVEWLEDIAAVRATIKRRDEDRADEILRQRKARERVPDMPPDEWRMYRGTVDRIDASVMRLETVLADMGRELRAIRAGMGSG